MPGLLTQPTSPKDVVVDAVLRGDPPEIAREHASDAYQIRDERQLDEEIAGWEEAVEAELARREEAAAVPPEPEPLSIDARLADAKRHRVQLAEARGRLSLPALTDEAVCLELSNVVADKEAVAVEIEDLELALKEKERLAPIEAAAEEKKSKAKAAAERLAAKEATRGAPLAKAVDQACEAFAIAVSEHRTHTRRHRELLEEAGTLKPNPFGYQGADLSYELALRFVLSSHDLGDVLERPQSSWGRPPTRPLAEPAEK